MTYFEKQQEAIKYLINCEKVKLQVAIDDRDLEAVAYSSNRIKELEEHFNNNIYYLGLFNAQLAESYINYVAKKEVCTDEKK